MIIDCHTHLGLHNDIDFKPEDLFKSMDEAQIDYSLVIANRTRGEGLNTDEIIEITQKYDRLKAIGNLEFDNLDESQIHKLLNLLEKKKIIGIKFFLGYEEFYAFDKKLFKLYQFCSDKGYPVMYHTGVLETGYSGLLKYSHPLTIDEVATKFPKLKIVIAHMGNPWIMDCEAVVLKNKNVYMDVSGFFDEYEPIRREQTELFINKLWELKQFMGNFNKCLFGTDWPLYNQSEYLDAFFKLQLTYVEKELTLWKNADSIFNINL